jgi:hypothetical protein
MFESLEFVQSGFVIVTYLIYLSMIVFLWKAKDNNQRMRYILIMATVLSIIHFSQQSWPLGSEQILIMLFLSLAGIDIKIGKDIVIALSLLYFISVFNQFFLSFLIYFVSYVVVSGSFILAAVDIMSLPGEKKK